jgi:GTPase Era involved in 16S rRNA processing
MPSQFVQEVTKCDLVTVGTNLRPYTTKILAIRCELTEEAKKALGVAMQKNIVFVDTPSFHTGQNDEVAEMEMQSWLSKSK